MTAKVTSYSICLSVIGTLIVILLLPVTSSATTITVEAKSNIYGAGHSVPPAPGGLGPGILPQEYSFSAAPRQLLTFSNVTGSISYNSGGSWWGPDGYDPWLFGQAFPPYDGISGIVTNSYEFLAGIFLDDSEPTDPAPTSLDFGPDGMTRNFTDVFPDIGQLFFIGDGLTDSGITQKFYVPDTATRLFLGYIDVDQNFLPGLYLDNLGSVTANFNLTPSEPLTSQETDILDFLPAILAGVLNTDNDWDGYSENQGDCNDSDFSIYPEAEEICGDGIDQDCNGVDLGCSTTVTRISPSLGPVGQWVYVHGTNFVEGDTTITFAGIFLIPALVYDSYQLGFRIPEGASGSDHIAVVTPFGSATSSAIFTVGVPDGIPTVIRISPNLGPVGQWVYVHGTNFVYGETTITFSGIAQIPTTVYGPTQLGFHVPEGASGSDKVRVDTPFGSATSMDSFTVNQ